MVISKSTKNVQNVYLHNEIIDQVSKYKYLGTFINEDNDSSAEFKIRIEKARSIFTKMKTVFCGRDLSLEMKLRLIRCYVLSLLFYGMESRTLNKIDTKKLEAFELWMYRRIL
ncbi:unnamed protein product, partial [Diabrotica balteata]